MNKIIVYLVIASIMLSGCMNCLVRFPTTSPKIEACYECTQTMAAFVIAGSFPQIVSECSSDDGFKWYNIFTVPLIGLPCLADTCIEACIDTVCLPADYLIIRAREKKD